MLQWDPVIRALEAQAPVWEPGTAHGYHATTYGSLVGEVVRRISGKSLGTFFAEAIAGPLDPEFWIALPAEPHHHVARLATCDHPSAPPQTGRAPCRARGGTLAATTASRGPLT